MSFGATPNTPPTKKLFGADPTKVASTQRATPLPYFAGRTRLGGTWAGKALRQKAVPVKEEGSSKAGAAGGSHKYYADLAYLVCLGPVDAITEIWMDDGRVWLGKVVRPGANADEGTTAANSSIGQVSADSANITIPDRGLMTIYWGTETQGIDPLLAAAGHPAYRGQCYLVFNQICLGTDATNAPNVEIVISRLPSVNTGALVYAPDIGPDCNPVHSVVELLTNHRYGAAFDPTVCLDLVNLQATAYQLAGEGLGLSPQITDVSSARDLLTHFCEYIDGWLESYGDDLLRLRLTRSNPAAVDTLPLLGEYDLLDVPQITPQAWRDTFNQMQLTFKNFGASFQDDSVTWYDQANLAATGVPRASSLDRPWVMDSTLANRLAAYNGRLVSVPHLTAKFTLRKEAVFRDDGTQIDVGDFLRITYADYQTTIIMRVTGRSVDQDRSQAVTLEVEADRYFDDVTAYTPELPPAGDVQPAEPAPVLFGRVIELPFDLVPTRLSNRRPQLVAVAARASTLDIHLKVYGSEDGETYDRLAHTRAFALYGVLAAPLSGSMHLLDNGPDGVLLSVPGYDPTNDAGETDFPSASGAGWIKGKLLLFIEDEIVAYQDAVVVGTNQVRFTGIRRALSDTLAADHVAGTPVLMVEKRDLCIFSEAGFEKNAQIEVKLATATSRGTLDLSGVAPIALTLTDRTERPLVPINLRINGALAQPTYTAGADIGIAWDITSWRRHQFWDAWDEPYEDVKLTHVIRVLKADGTLVRKMYIDVGGTSYAYAAADFAADFGSVNPASFQVQVYARFRGIKSSYPISMTVTLAN